MANTGTCIAMVQISSFQHHVLAKLYLAFQFQCLNTELLGSEKIEFINESYEKFLDINIRTFDK